MKKKAKKKAEPTYFTGTSELWCIVCKEYTEHHGIRKWNKRWKCKKCKHEQE